MQRREFLVRLGGVVIAVPALLELVGCGDDGPTDAPRGYDVTNASDSTGHTHQIRVLCGDLTAGGAVTYTSTSAGHTHTVSLTMADIQMIVGGGQVTKTSSSGGGHTHNWTVRTPAGAC